MRYAPLAKPFILLAVMTAAAQAEQTAGYGRDGSRIFPDRKPPTAFSLPKDLRWEFRLKGWGHSSPVVVQDQVIVTIEATPDCDWPQLVSVDLKTGKERWRAVLDGAEAISGGDAAKRKTITDDWHLFRQKTIKNYRFREAFRQNPDKALKDWIAEGGTYSPPDHKPKMSHPCYAPADAARDRCIAVGLVAETYHEIRNQSGIDAIGHTFSTPASDGKTIYVATAQGFYAAFDLTGKRLWMTYSKGNIHNGDTCYNGRSPILYQNLLISDPTNKLRAFDVVSGKLLWSDDAPAGPMGGDVASNNDEGAHTIQSPMVMTVGGKDVLIAAGGHFYLLPEGKRVKMDGWREFGMQTLVKHDERDVVFFGGEGEHCGWTGKGICPTPPPAAIRFAWQGQDLKATILWSGINGKPFGGNLPWMVYNAGKLFCPGRGAVDGKTGKILFGDFNTKRIYSLTETPRTGHLLQIANGHVYGLHGTTNVKPQQGAGFMDVCTIDGKGVASSIIPPEEFDASETAAWSGCALYYNIVGRFSHGWQFTFSKDAIILRSNLRIYCIGPK